ncbi:MAG: right-handed parallel beta-helix repeat-containing protein, partial [Cyclobacteriaceae bacterium]
MNTVLSKLILCCSLLLFSLNIHAANYYFSDKTGNDSRSSSQAQNPDTPWKSISKLNAFFTDLNPGDKVFFKRGEVFSGEIILNNSGSSDRPIIIGAYGTGSKPVITSIVHLTNWKSIGNGIFESSHPDLDFNELNVVLLNNEKQEMGRYPNSDAPNKGYLNYEFSSGNQSITSKELNASPNWSGAEVVVRKNFWVIDRHRITNHSGNTVNYAPNPESSYHPTANYGFFIQNHVKTLDKLGEWYYNSSSKKFNMYFGNSSPGSPSVEVSTSDHIVTNSKSTSNIVFENLHFRGANKNVLFLEGGSNIKVLACDIEYGGDNGLFMNGIVDFEIANSTVIGSGNNGILLGTSKNAIVRNNLVKDTYLLPGLTRGGDNRGVSISTTSDNNLIENNQVINSGYIGIRFGGNQTIVRNNLINYFCLTKNDGGGIYAYGSKSTTHSGRKVSNNIILNGIGVKEGSNLRNHLS